MVRVAVEGCCHGELDTIYDTVLEMNAELLRRDEETVSLLLICGDFQAVRNEDDLECMACPRKYRQLGDFYKYYTGERRAPIPTLFIGGNHEASNYMQELFYGGYVAPDIYYLGQTGCVRFKGLRIAGISGIYNSGSFLRARRERPPYDDGALRSVYHVRACDVMRVSRLGGRGNAAAAVAAMSDRDAGDAPVCAPAGDGDGVDVFLSHDWPCGIARFGNCKSLLRKKPFLRSEVEDGSLGCPYGRELLLRLRPRYWFSAHLHVKYAAVVRHGTENQAEAEGLRAGKGVGADVTRFLALDKVLPNRDFLQLVDIEPPDGRGDSAGSRFEYDPEWLAILAATHGSEMNREKPVPGASAEPSPTPQQIHAVVRQAQEYSKRRGRDAGAIDNGDDRGSLEIPMFDTFFRTVHPPYQRPGRMPTSLVPNPQTLSVLEMLRLPLHSDPATATIRGAGDRGHQQYTPPQQQQQVQQYRVDAGHVAVDASDPNEIDIG